MPNGRSGLDKHETRSLLASFNRNLVFRMVFESVCGSGTFVFAAFALAVGLRRENMGFVAGVASLASLLQMLGLPVVARVRDRRALVLGLGFAEPLVMIGAVAAVPLLAAAGRMVALTLAAFFAAACVNLTRPVLDDWIASVIPQELRGRYWGRRLRLMSIASLVIVPTVGFIANRLGRNNTPGLAALLCAGGAFGVLAAWALRAAVIPTLMPIRPVRFLDIGPVFRVPEFRRYLLGLTVTFAPFFFACAYYQVFHLTVLQMNLWTASCTMLLYGAVKTVAAPMWGRVVGRLGARRVLFLTLPLYVVFFAAYPLPAPERVWPVFAAWALAGVTDPAWGVATQITLYRSVPPTGVRPAFFAVSSLVSFGLYGLGAVLSVPVLKWLAPMRLVCGPLVFDQFRLFYGGIMLLAAACVLGAALFPGPEEGAQSPTVGNPR